ncbi:hypothetical protein WI72_09670 [Burkholderia ubonensis]|uniref:phage tail assembly protein T n=1 Tax=Burkholderia ubonensis TaxID=101571 RepID=UPI0007597C34|nr:hypothetical protein [Burkholderia ubonensis]KVC62703.1 hypothetical protein WI72_09670 [Burkholderia ubonensis]
MTVRQLLANLDSSELTEWMAFERVEAIGEARADLRAGIIAAAIGNHSNRTLPKPYRASDFMPYLPRVEDKPIFFDDPEQQSATILKLVFNRT